MWSQIPSKLLPANVTSLAQNTPVGPGIALMNVVEFTPQGILNALAGDTSYGVNVGLLTSPPTFNLGQETSNLLDNVIGGIPQLQGALQLTSQQVTMDVEFAQITRENLEMALPGLQTTTWNSGAHAGVTVGTGNAAFTLRALTSGVGPNTNYTVVVNAPAGATTTVAVSGTLPARVFTISPATGATANDIIRAVNLDPTANDYVRAGKPASSNGTGAVASATSTPFAGGSAGASIGQKFTHKGFWTSSDYSMNFVAAFESANTRVASILRVDNVISMDDFSFSPEDTQVLTGNGMTLTATATDSDYDPSTGSYKPPMAWYLLDPVAV